MLPTTVEDNIKFKAGGVLFNSVEDLCRFWRISKKEIVLHMRTAHCSLQVALDFLAERSKTKQAVTAPVPAETKGTQVPKVDHLGRHFESASAMCSFYKLEFKLVYKRLFLGWSLEQSLTAPVRRIKANRSIPCQDHIGREFPSLSAMCVFYGVQTKTFLARRRLGWSLKRSLTVPVQRKKSAYK